MNNTLEDDLLGMTISDAEGGLLGIVMITNGKALDNLTLRGADFSEPKLGEIYDTMVKMRAEGIGIDEITVGDRLPRLSTELFKYRQMAITEANLTYYAEIILGRSITTQYRHLANGIIEMSETTNAKELEAWVEHIMGKMHTSALASRPETFADLLEPTLAELEGGTQNLLSTPWPSLNELMGGFRPGGLYIIAARPGDGKTLVAMQLALHMAKHAGWVSFNSLEMRGEELLKRAISAMAGVHSRKINNGELDTKDWARIYGRKGDIAQVRMAIDSDASATISSIRRHARSVSKMGELSAIFVDYLQLLSDPAGAENRQVAVSGFSRSLKILSKELNVPVIALSQLKRSDKRATIQDLRESGSLEQDADGVIILERDVQASEITFNLAKHRHGPAGEVQMVWEGGFSRVSEFGPVL